MWQPRRMSGNGSREIAVGCRVQTTDTPPQRGVVVEDFGDLAGQRVVIDADRTARSRRWAIKLDDGNLVFCDDHSVQVVD